MSRQAHLPPRCPFPNKRISPGLCNDQGFHPQHHRSSSQSFIAEEQPAWLDDLLCDPDFNPKGIIHRRSSSESVTLLDSIGDSFPSLNPLDDDNDSSSNGTDCQLESACIYGPNSPRRRRNLTFSENAIVSALSVCVSKDYVDGSTCLSGSPELDLKGDPCGSLGDPRAETKLKRHFGQRSRVRKIQYIAELEKTVEFFQTLESELAVRVSSLLQQRAALSFKNSNLKQQLAMMQQKKLFVEDQYQCLKKELEGLKMSSTNSQKNKPQYYSGMTRVAEPSRSEVNWQMLDMGKLNLS